MWIIALSPFVHSPKVHLISVYVLCEASSKFLCLDLAIQQVSPLFPCPAAQITCANIPSAPALPRFCHPAALTCRLGDLLAASTTSPASFIFRAWFALTLSSGCCVSSHINQWLRCTLESFALLKESTLSERQRFFVHWDFFPKILFEVLCKSLTFLSTVLTLTQHYIKAQCHWFLQCEFSFSILLSLSLGPEVDRLWQEMHEQWFVRGLSDTDSWLILVGSGLEWRGIGVIFASVEKVKLIQRQANSKQMQREHFKPCLWLLKH